MIRKLHEADPDPDYCQCGRGPVVGLLTYTSSRVWFRVADEGTPGWDQGAADLRCLDCVTDAVADVASGKVREEMRRLARERLTVPPAPAAPPGTHGRGHTAPAPTTGPSEPAEARAAPCPRTRPRGDREERTHGRKGQRWATGRTAGQAGHSSHGQPPSNTPSPKRPRGNSAKPAATRHYAKPGTEAYHPTRWRDG